MGFREWQSTDYPLVARRLNAALKTRLGFELSDRKTFQQGKNWRWRILFFLSDLKMYWKHIGHSFLHLHTKLPSPAQNLYFENTFLYFNDSVQPHPYHCPDLGPSPHLVNTLWCEPVSLSLIVQYFSVILRLSYVLCSCLCIFYFSLCKSSICHQSARFLVPSLSTSLWLWKKRKWWT